MDYIESRYFEIFLSALIQASYNQGNNNFVFENVDTNFFAELLMGKKEDPIKIEAQAISGNNAFRRAQNCTLEIASYTGLRFGHMMGNCQICTYDKGDLDRIRRQVFWGKNNSFRLLKK
ncbi:hypothetical protein HY643_04365 [Candidatus Woesearchaeota archaeon]|nr:hypothetical protein [Candidatus Woesearchaeota archaeon]